MLFPFLTNLFFIFDFSFVLKRCSNVIIVTAFPRIVVEVIVLVDFAFAHQYEEQGYFGIRFVGGLGSAENEGAA